uniref:Glucosamine 6-phosphate N-acetyltransferase n=1 Tax=Astyanax mexicanus TaxID=7994 RepID=A0A8B9KCD1_ASTMX
MLLDETPLFDSSLLQDLDWGSNTVSFCPPISPSAPGEGLLLRPLCPADFDRGTVFWILTVGGDVHAVLLSFCFLTANFEHMRRTGDYYVIVVEDTNLGQIVATATLIVEHKFIHSCAKVPSTPLILLVSTLTLLSRKLQCYKITLECAENNVDFYKKFGYSPSEETYMQCRFFD